MQKLSALNKSLIGTIVLIYIWLAVPNVFGAFAVALPSFRRVDGYPWVKLESSVPFTVFWKEGKSGEIKAGGYVCLSGLDKPYVNPSMRLIKRAACVEGEGLYIMDRDYFCRHPGGFEWIATARNETSAGRPLRMFLPENARTAGKLAWAVVPHGHVFVAGNHAKSYDSRYFGYVPLAKVTATLCPLL